jgi:hypothetical protein
VGTFFVRLFSIDWCYFPQLLKYTLLSALAQDVLASAFATGRGRP